jgi:hypothetical protein
MIVHGIPNSLLATQVTFRRLYGNMAQQELDLVQFTSSRMADPRTRPPEIVRREFGDSSFAGELLHYTPNGLLRKLFSPDSAGPVNSPEQRSTADAGGRKPVIQQLSQQLCNGIGRIWPDFPIRSTMAQCSSRC